MAGKQRRSSHAVQRLRRRELELKIEVGALVSKAQARTITLAENEILIRKRHELKQVRRSIQHAGDAARVDEFDPYDRKKSKGSSRKQGPAGGVTGVVSGGLPGLGKR